MSRNLRTVWRKQSEDHDYGDVPPRVGDAYEVEDGATFANQAELTSLVRAGKAKWYSVAHDCGRCGTRLYQQRGDVLCPVGVQAIKTIVDPKTLKDKDVSVTHFFGQVWCTACKAKMEIDARRRKDQARAKATAGGER